MNKIKSTLLFAGLLISATSLAQDLSSGYFNDNYLYRHDLNPAFGNEKNYISMPLLGNINANIRGNFGLKDVLYKVNGRTALFLNPAVSSVEFDKNINDNNKLTEDLKIQLLGAGFKGFGGYNTFEVNMVQGLDARIPGSILKAAKDGLTNQTYDFSHVEANAQAYAEIALGHSHKINDKLRIGAKLKFLLGVANFDMNLNKATLTLGENNYTAIVDAEVQANVKELTYKQDVNSRTGHKYVSGVDKVKWGVSGIGFAVDLGAEYKLDNWDFSLAVQNLGFINYSKNYKASTNGEKSIETDKYIFNVDDKATNSFENEFDNLKDDFSALYELDNYGDTGGRKKGHGATLNAGVKYTLPSYKRLSFGLMNSTRLGEYGWTDFRLGVNIRPIDAVAFSANVSAGTYGMGFGWLLDLQANKGLDLFVAMDVTPGKLAKQYIPLSSNMQVSMGLNFPF